MPDLRTVPTLDELGEHPERAAGLSPETLAALYAKLRQTEAALLTRLLMRPATVVATGNGADDQLLGSEEVARMIGRGKSWVEHHLDDLPPRRSLLGAPVWLKRDVERWIQSLPKYGAATT